MRKAFYSLAAVLAAGNVQAEGFVPYDNPSAVRAGQQIYAENCASCHGANLEGEPNWRDRDAEGYLPAPPHDASGHTWHHPDRILFLTTKYGTEAMVGGGYRSRMAGYEDILSDGDILAVLAFIKSTWPAAVIRRHDMINAQADQ
ncbi:c-type cytochrome [Thalassovita sp.]|jgi:mono/diheme cytochrome c family protein|uniref:c-type cytochrome n=1 Tax=Thalassovita sp. TaxID=1979401 RepID=UPI003B5BE869